MTTSLPQATHLQTNRPERWVRFFDTIAATDIARVGGKTANLGELSRAGLPVPPGFCVVTDAYAAVAGQIGVDALIAELTPETTQPRQAEIAALIRQRFEETILPLDVADAVRAAYWYLGNGDALPVAVRSSATAEDLPFASFAGQQDTYLNIVGEDALLDAVRRCWGSLWTDRAVSYRLRNRIASRQVRLAVIVQRMVDVSVAGVLFTANPLSGRRDQTVIDASPGLGEAVVSGAVNPDHFVVDTRTGEIVERRLGDKRVMIQARPGGGTQRIEREGQPDQPCLRDEQIQALARIGSRVEALYGAPQDIEWAFDADGNLWLTQARPITTLYPLPVRQAAGDAALRVYFSFNVAQGVFQPLTPMAIDTFRSFATVMRRLAGVVATSNESEAGFLVDPGMRIYLDFTALFRASFGRRLLAVLLPHVEARSAALARSLASDPRLSVGSSGLRTGIRRAMNLAVRLRIPQHIMHAIVRPAAARRRVLRLQQTLQRELAIPDDASSLERLHAVESARRVVPTILSTVMPVMVTGIGSFALASKLLGDLATADERQAVLRSLPHNPTTEMDLALWTMAQQIRSDATAAATVRASSASTLAEAYRQHALPLVVQENLAAFLGQYGHRGVAEIDLGVPRWSDDPTHILGVLLNYLRLNDAASGPDAQFARGAEQAEATVWILTTRAMRRSWLRGWLVYACLRRTRELAGLRERPKFYLVWLFARMRDILRPVAKELTQAGRIEQEEDIYFLSFAEVRAALQGTDMRASIRERRATYDHEMQRRHIPRILLSDGSQPTPDATDHRDTRVVHGTPASAGTVTARARVILDPVGAHLEPGEILVAPSTDPGWTPLFLTAGGLVMEMGGAMSHGAVVAREYGIPAVVGAADATTRIETGQTITVNGSNGTIALAEPDAAQPSGGAGPDAGSSIRGSSSAGLGRS